MKFRNRREMVPPIPQLKTGNATSTLWAGILLIILATHTYVLSYPMDTYLLLLLDKVLLYSNSCSPLHPREVLTLAFLGLADDPRVLPYTPESPALRWIPDMGKVQSVGVGRPGRSGHSRVEPTVNLPENLHKETNAGGPLMVGALHELVLDREVESNIVPFLAHAFTSWLNRFIFEPARASSLARATIVRGHSLGEETHQRMILVANTVLAVSKSTNYEPKYYTILYQQLVKRVLEARTCNILSPQDEELLDADDRPGLRLSIGVPDRLVIALARINILLEDHGSCVDQKMVQELKTEITRACKPVDSSSPEDDPALMVGKITVQESWRLVGYVYLYMGLCGADSKDARVINAQQQFMALLETVKPRRNPDLFLIIPMVIMGIATSSPTDQSILFSRLWGVTECSKPGTVGNDVTRMLNDIWERTRDRPTVWSDLRIACLRVTGM
ncbi:unnamed protein product [Rhizoctonia solani]|uniref:Uncharacterized protein n=1 Tax=Rhizoctonia solani TaxID=456999 RepID=A0A8H3B702_9AGAM|nr:unnamed protein product [Rhizoctonia solani]